MKQTHYLQLTPNKSAPFKPLERSTEMVIAVAESRGYTVAQIPDTGLFEITTPEKTIVYKPQILPSTNFSGYYLAANKNATKRVLERAKISVSPGFFIHRRSYNAQLVNDIFATLTCPLVVKPNDATQGRGVYMNIISLPQLDEAVQEILTKASGEDSGVVIEEQFDGNEYRVLATPEKILGIIYRIPANVTGDGSSTIAQLIEVKNSDPRRLPDPNAVLVTIKVDEVVTRHLREQGRSTDSVPAKDEVVYLRPNSNISTGGDSIDVTDTAHASVKEIALQTMACLPGLAIGGIDFMTKDITQAQSAPSYRILEVNSSPGFSIHQEPYQGTARDIATIYLDLLLK
ncbi:MAG: hypothetical protein M3Q81_03735 [bacterium]|nr:hypothetical protein [bacterium]